MTKIKSLRLEFNSDLGEKSYVEIKFVRLKFHREERKNEEGEETQQNKEEIPSRNLVEQRRRNPEHHKPMWNFFQKPKKREKKRKKSISKKKNPTLMMKLWTDSVWTWLVIARIDWKSNNKGLKEISLKMKKKPSRRRTDWRWWRRRNLGKWRNPRWFLRLEFHVDFFFHIRPPTPYNSSFIDSSFTLNSSFKDSNC